MLVGACRQACGNENGGPSRLTQTRRLDVYDAIPTFVSICRMLYV